MPLVRKQKPHLLAFILILRRNDEAVQQKRRQKREEEAAQNVNRKQNQKTEAFFVGRLFGNF